METETRGEVAGGYFLQEEIVKRPPRSEGACGQLGHTPASRLAVRTSLSQNGAPGTLTSHGGPGKSQAPLCSALQIISLSKSRGGGVGAPGRCTAGIWGQG